jgi:glutamyl-tRNA synthetase
VQRSLPEYTQAIFDAFAWVNIQPDEPVVIQSSRFPEHEKILQHMLAQGTAYKCFCSPQEVLERLRIQGESDEFVLYDGFCRDADQAQDRSFVIRFKRPLEQQTISFDDIIRGLVTFEIAQFDDFILARSDGQPMYNFVVVADDAFMKITHIIRGEEHLSNTPKQIMLYQALGYAIPRFAHLPLILGPSGNKLSKREAATNVMEYRENGYLPNALINYLVRLGWAHGDQEVFSRDELIQYFTLDHVGKKGAIFDQQKLDWLNSVYLRAMSASELVAYIQHQMNVSLPNICHDWHEQTLLETLDLYKERCSTLKELVRLIHDFHKGPQTFDAALLEKWIDAKTADLLSMLMPRLQELVSFTADTIMQTAKDLAKEQGIKMVSVAQPVRIAMIGTSEGPGAFHLVALLGKEEALKRLRVLYGAISG